MTICIISVYFGTLPNYFNLWLQSCAYNNKIDFLLVTDQKVSPLPDNVRTLAYDLHSFKELAQAKLGEEIRLEQPYKCCDYKPMYGLILEEYLKSYDFWGHCDIDLVFGDLLSFITEEVLRKYSKIYHLGHLSLYKNTKQINEAFKLPGSLRCDWQFVINTDKICVFDEEFGIDRIFEKNGLPIYTSLDFADIDFCIKRLIAIRKNNYKNQLFCFEEGHCYRYYVEGKEIKRDEFSYIHMQQRKFGNTLQPTNSSRFAILKDTFIPLINDVTINDIKKWNPYSHFLLEKVEYYFNWYAFLIRRKIRGSHL